jgi:ATP-binding cassette subfamily C exporter for protease/lipase
MLFKSIFNRYASSMRSIVFFSFFTNVLTLSSTWYMLEVYDRVISSQNQSTLIMLTLLVAGLYALLEALDWIRSHMMKNIALNFVKNHMERLFKIIFEIRLKKLNDHASQVIFDLKTVQEVIASSAFLVLIDIPFMFISMLIIFLIHPSLALYVIISAVIIGVIAIINHKLTEPNLKEANQHQVASQGFVNETIQQAEVIKALGMTEGIRALWIAKQNKVLASQVIASNQANFNITTSKFIQSLQGSMLLGLSCWLILRGDPDMHASMMIVASVLGGRALSPLVSIISHWKTLSAGVNALKRIEQVLETFPEKNEPMSLPPPEGDITVENLVAGAPKSSQSIIRGVNLKLAAGQTLAIIGPSGSGKTTLAKLILGIWPAFQGKVRLDGIDIYQWSKNELGDHIGYLPQSFDLFAGTIAENIGRFKEINMDCIKEAATIVGLHPFIEALQNGYDTDIGNEGSYLSGGQRQRIALARAIYNNPKLIVLDEPTANLDREGDQALIETIKTMQSKGSTIIFIAHHRYLIELADHILVLVEGQTKLFGPKNEVIAKLNPEAH